MLYDPKWTNNRPTLAGFTAWLETKDPDQHYNYCSPRDCACGQYAAFIGQYEDWMDNNTHIRVWKILDDSALKVAKPRTFGALLQVVREATP